MSTDTTQTQEESANINALKQNLHRFEPLLDLSGEWAASNAEWEHYRPQDVMTFLKHNGAVRIVEKDWYWNENCDIRNIYRWNPNTKEKMIAYRDGLNRFKDFIDGGCRHKAQIHWNDDNEFSCPQCGQTYTRAEMENVDL